MPDFAMDVFQLDERNPSMEYRNELKEPTTTCRPIIEGTMDTTVNSVKTTDPNTQLTTDDASSTAYDNLHRQHLPLKPSLHVRGGRGRGMPRKNKEASNQSRIPVKQALCMDVPRPDVDLRYLNHFAAVRNDSSDDSLASPVPFDCLLLNGALPNYTGAALTTATGIVCCDGGANRLLRYLKDQKDSRRFDKDITVVGDFDSVTPDAIKNLGTIFRKVHVRHIGSQNSTDLEKGIKLVLSQRRNRKKKDATDGNSISVAPVRSPIVVIGAFGGRLDHSICALHLLYKYRSNIVMAGDTSLATLIPSGTTKIRIPKDFVDCQCAYFPLRNFVDVTTSGLRWDVTHQRMQVGRFISTSNQISPENIDGLVEISTSGKLIWYMHTKVDDVTSGS